MFQSNNILMTPRCPESLVIHVDTTYKTTPFLAELLANGELATNYCQDPSDLRDVKNLVGLTSAEVSFALLDYSSSMTGPGHTGQHRAFGHITMPTLVHLRLELACATKNVLPRIFFTRLPSKSLVRVPSHMASIDRKDNSLSWVSFAVTVGVRLHGTALAACCSTRQTSVTALLFYRHMSRTRNAFRMIDSFHIEMTVSFFRKAGCTMPPSSSSCALDSAWPGDTKWPIAGVTQPLSALFPTHSLSSAISDDCGAEVVPWKPPSMGRAPLLTWWDEALDGPPSTVLNSAVAPSTAWCLFAFGASTSV